MPIWLGKIGTLVIILVLATWPGKFVYFKQKNTKVLYFIRIFKISSVLMFASVCFTTYNNNTSCLPHSIPPSCLKYDNRSPGHGVDNDFETTGVQVTASAMILRQQESRSRRPQWFCDNRSPGHGVRNDFVTTGVQVMASTMILWQQESRSRRPQWFCDNRSPGHGVNNDFVTTGVQVTASTMILWQQESRSRSQ
jgi:hypothetical protein